MPSDDTQYYSAGRPIPLSLVDTRDPQAALKQALRVGEIEAAKRRDLASNRLATVTSRQKVLHQFEFDDLGRLTRFPSVTDDRSVTWHVTYDLLGRATAMRGYRAGKEQPEIELEFASDVFNRRILKQVQDHLAPTHRLRDDVSWNEPLVVMKRGGDTDGSWDVTAQYLWGPSVREIIMAVLPSGSGRTATDPGMGEVLSSPGPDAECVPVYRLEKRQG